MLKTTIAVLMAASIFTYSSAIPVIAQADQVKRDRKAAEVKTKIGKIGTGEKARVKVKLYDKTRYEGHLREVTDSGFVVVTKEGNSHTVGYSDVDSLGGRSLSTGAKIGIGAGIGAGATILIILAIIASND